MSRILLVEDDDVIREMTRLSLERDGFAVTTAPDGQAGLAAFRDAPPDLALLDIMLPGIDGVTVCRAIRADGPTPVIMLTARTDAIDVVLGLEAGADDYVTKPFDPPVLAARIRAVLRRSSREPVTEVLRFGDLVIDRPAMEATRDGEQIRLTATEFRLLADLAENAGIVRSREALLEDVWGYIWSGDTRLVDIHVQRLRAKIGADAIETVRGVGYKLARR
jgi:DNA-binding response OmpR family regulator